MSSGHDVVVVGGGSAGMTAALWLARYRRKTLLVDAGEPRNRATWAVHGYPGLADPTPAQLREATLSQVLAAGAVRRDARVTRVEGERDAFHIVDDAGGSHGARRVLLAYGLRDRLPELDGIEQLYGVSVFHCPDCDGPSMSGGRVGVIGWDRHAASLALYLLTWAREVVLLLNGHQPLFDQHARDVLDRHGVTTRAERLTGLDRAGQALFACAFGSGEKIRLDGLFFHLGADAATGLGRDLDCDHDDHGFIRVDDSQETSVRGVFAAGDITGKPHLALWAAAEGMRAALSIHRSLLPAELDL